MVSDTTKGLLLVGGLGALFFLTQGSQEDQVFGGSGGLYGGSGSNVDNAQNDSLSSALSSFLTPSSFSEPTNITTSSTYSGSSTKKELASTYNLSGTQQIALSRVLANDPNRFGISGEGGAIVDRYSQQSFSFDSGIKRIQSEMTSKPVTTTKKQAKDPYKDFGSALKVK